MPKLFNVSTENLEKGRGTQHYLIHKWHPALVVSNHSRAGLPFRGRGPWKPRRMDKEKYHEFQQRKTRVKSYIQGRLILYINTNREVTDVQQAKNISSVSLQYVG